MIRNTANRKGNIVAMLFGSVALVGLLGVSVNNLVVGPATTVNKVTQQNMTQNDLLMNAKVIVMHASTLPQMGDEDGDGYVEPVAFIPTSDDSCNITLPGQGGCLPQNIGVIQTDPWGTQYAYCVWDHGDPASSTNRIDGEDSTSGAVLAIISAGPNKRFETPCLPYDGDPETNDIAINPSGVGDDLVQIYTYAGAVAGSGGLWELKLNEPETAVIDKKLEIGDVSAGTGFAFDTVTGEGEFPYVKTDYLASKSGGTTPITMDSNIALDGRWLSGDGGNEGVFVDADGRVGIGTANPETFLDIGRKDFTVARLRGGNGHYYINIQDGTGRINHYWNTRGTTTPTFENGGESALNFKAHPYGGYGFQFNYADGTSAAAGDPIIWSNLMTLSVDGNVGIGTSGPTSKLHVSGNGRFSGSLSINGPIYNDHTDANYDLWIQGGAASASGDARNLALLGHVSQDRLYVNYNSEYAGGTTIGGPVTVKGKTTLNDAIYIPDMWLGKGLGNVGLGPDIWLGAQGLIVADSNLYLVADATGDGNGSIIFSTGGSTTAALTEQVRITTSGRVGMGTTTPTERLDVGGGNIKMGYEIVNKTCTNVASTGTGCHATCPAGKVPIGGGCHMHNGGYVRITMIYADLNAWSCYANNAPQTMTAQAICANMR